VKSRNHPQVIINPEKAAIFMAVDPFLEVLGIKSYIFAQLDKRDICILEPVLYDTDFDLAICCRVIYGPEFFRLPIHKTH
jgi:hypothetical protein